MGITMNDYREAGVHTASETQGRPQSASAGSSVRAFGDAPSSSASPSSPAPTPVPGPVISQALSDAGLTDNTRNRQIVSSLIAQELPIDAETLKSVARALSSYPNESPDAVILLRSAGVEITPASLEDANAFLAAREMLLDSLGEIDSYIEGSGILSEADAYAAPSDQPSAAPFSADAGNLTSGAEISSPRGQSSAPLGTAGGQSQTAGSPIPASDSLFSSAQITNNRAVQTPGPNPSQGTLGRSSDIISNHTPSSPSLVQEAVGFPSNADSAQGTGELPSNSDFAHGTVGSSSNTGISQPSTAPDGQFTADVSTPDTTGRTSESGHAPVTEGLTSNKGIAQTAAAPNGQISADGPATGTIGRTLGSNPAQNTTGQTTDVANTPGTTGQTSDTAPGGQTSTVSAVQNAQAHSDPTAPLDASQTTTEHPALRPLSEVPMRELVSVLSEKPGLEPSDISSEGIKRFLESAVTYLENAREVSHRRGDEAMAAKVDKAMNSMRTMLKLNDMYAYAEVPVKNEDEGKKTHLRFFANKKTRIRKDEGSSAVLHLNMPSLKELDIRMVLKGNSLRVDFFSSKDASSLLEAEIGALSERLSAIGIDPTMDFHERTKESPSDNSILQQATQNPTVPLQGIRGFDTRA